MCAGGCDSSYFGSHSCLWSQQPGQHRLRVRLRTAAGGGALWIWSEIISVSNQQLSLEATDKSASPAQKGSDSFKYCFQRTRLHVYTQHGKVIKTDQNPTAPATSCHIKTKLQLPTLKNLIKLLCPFAVFFLFFLYSRVFGLLPFLLRQKTNIWSRCLVFGSGWYVKITKQCKNLTLCDHVGPPSTHVSCLWFFFVEHNFSLLTENLSFVNFSVDVWRKISFGSWNTKAQC